LSTTTTIFFDPEVGKNLVSDILLMFVIWLKGMWSKDLDPFKHNDRLDTSQPGVPLKRMSLPLEDYLTGILMLRVWSRSRKHAKK
jgi:hypothetical protein